MKRMTWVLSAALLAGVSVAQDDGLVLYLPFETDTGATVLDASGNGYNGTAANCAWASEGRFTDGAMEFNGVNSSVGISAVPNFPAWNTYSASVWFKHDGRALSIGYKVLDKTSMFHDWHLMIWSNLPSYSPGCFGFWAYENGTAVRLVDTSRDFRDNQWHHAVVVRNGTSIQLWVDGVLSDSANTMFPVYTTSALCIGNSFSSDWNQHLSWSGLIDEVRIYDRALSPAEITKLYTEGEQELPPVTTYTVTFDAQDGEVSPGSADVTVGEAYGTLPTPAREGYTFGGWFTDPGGEGEQVENSTTVTLTETHTLYAHWTVTPPPNLSEGLVLYLPFETDTGATVLDASGNGHNGTAANCVWKNEGRFTGGAMEFNGVFGTSGRSRIEMANAPDFPTWDAYSVSVWVKHYGGGQTPQGHKIVDKTSMWHDWHLSISPPDPRSGGFNFRAYENGMGVEFWTTVQDYRDNQWHHVVVVRSGTNIQLWVDGTLHVSMGGMCSVYSTSALCIGNSFSTDVNQQASWKGLIDEVRIYNRALSPAEITKLYAEGEQELPPVTTYTVTFDAQDGEVSPGSADVTVGEAYGTLPTPAREGYTFGGWFTEPGGEGEQVENSTTVTLTETHTLYAHWTVTPPPNLSEGLVLYLPFETDTGATVLDASGNGYNGTAANCAWTSEGRFAGGAMSFNGVNSSVVLPTAPDFPTWNTYSVSVWFKHDGGGYHGGTQYGHKIIDKTSFLHDWRLNVCPHVSPPGYISFGAYEGEVKAVMSDSSRNYMNETWHHAVIVRDGANGQFWVDGELKDSVSNMASVYSTSALCIGNSFSTDPFQCTSWSGLIDEVRIYDRALSSAEIAKLYTEGEQELPPVTYTVTFDAQDGEVSPGSADVTVGEAYGTLPVPTREGYTFEGWFTDPGGEGELIEDTTAVALASDHTLYAHWIKIPDPVPDPYLSDPSAASGNSDGADTPPLATTAYDGFVYDSDNAVRGTMKLNARATVKADKKTGIVTTNWTFSAKAVLQTASVSFSGKSEGAAERFQAVSKDGAEALDVRIEGGRFYGTLSGGKAGGEFQVDGVRAVFADKRDALAQMRLNTLRGVYNVAFLDTGETALPVGHVSLSVGNSGTVKLAGRLAGGVSISGSARLLEGLNEDGWLAIALHRPLYSKKGFIGGLLWLDLDEKVIRIDTAYDWYVNWVCEAPKRVPFAYELDVLGGWFGDGKVAPPTPEGLLFSAGGFGELALPSPVAGLLYGRWVDEALPWGLSTSGLKLSLPKGASPVKGVTAYHYTGDNPSLATLSYTDKTGVFKGSFKLYYDGFNAKGAPWHKAVNVSYSGAMTPDNGELRGLGIGTATINKEKIGIPVFLEK